MLGTTPRDWLLALASVLLLTAGNAGAAEPEREAGGSIPGGIWRYAERWVARHDADRDGRLAATEWQPLGAAPGEADANQDAVLSVEELAQHLADYGAHRKIRLMPADAGRGVPLPSLLRPGETAAKRQPAGGETGSTGPPDEAPADERTPEDSGADSTQDRLRQRKYFVSPSRLPAGLPDWFDKCDRDGDGQLTLAEYGERGSASADKEFARYDRNQDGLITPREVLGGAANVKRGPPSPTAGSEAERKPAAPEAGGNGRK